MPRTELYCLTPSKPITSHRIASTIAEAETAGDEA
jgi:hypothetical protein